MIAKKILSVFRLPNRYSTEIAQEHEQRLRNISVAIHSISYNLQKRINAENKHW